MGITVFISLWTTRLVLNALGTSDFGIFGIVGGAIAMLGFLNASMSNTTQRYMSFSQGEQDEHKQRLIFNNSLVIHIMIALVLFVILELAVYPMFKYILNLPAERLFAAHCLYQFLIMSTIFTVISVPYDAAINAHENMRFYAILGGIESFLKLFVAFLVVNTLYDKLIVYGLLMAFIPLILLVTKYIYCSRKYKECRALLKRYYQKSTSIELIKFAGWIFVDAVGSLFGNNGGDIVMNHFFGPSMNAAGNIGSQLRGQMLAFSNSMLKAINPVIYKKEGEGERDGMLNYTLTGAKLSFLLFAFLAIPFVIDSAYILKIWLLNVPAWTVVFSRLQMLTGLGEQLTIILGTAVAASGNIKNNCIFSGVAHIAPIPIYIYLFYIGADPYWLYLIILINFVFIIGGYKIFQCHIQCGLNIQRYIKEVVMPCIFCSLISFIAGWIIKAYFCDSFFRLITIFSVTDVILFMSSYYLMLNIPEKKYIASVLKRLVTRIK